MTTLGALAIMLALSPLTAWAGFCSGTPTDAPPRHDFQFFAGYSPASSTIIGTEPDRRFVSAGFEYSYRCWIWNSTSISYTAGAMPAAILIQPNGHGVYGFGITPIGLTFEIARRHGLHPFVEVNGGLIASVEPIPERQPDATGLNFLIDFGGGVRLSVGKKGALSLGYKFLHISNAFTTNFNPGVDNSVFYVGYSILR